ncbi:MAG: hypothetical protein ACXU9W_15905, partial [Thermodesulfobacteriota bacterium]
TGWKACLTKADHNDKGAERYVNHLGVFGKGFGKTFFAKKVFPNIPLGFKPAPYLTGGRAV